MHPGIQEHAHSKSMLPIPNPRVPYAPAIHSLPPWRLPHLATKDTAASPAGISLSAWVPPGGAEAEVEGAAGEAPSHSPAPPGPAGKTRGSAAASPTRDTVTDCTRGQGEGGAKNAATNKTVEGVSK